MPLQFSFADFMTVFAILGALGVIPIADTYRTHLADHIYRYRRVQRYRFNKDPWFSFRAFVPALLVLFAAYAIRRRQVSPFHKRVLYLLLITLTILPSILLMFPTLVSWIFMDHMFLNYPYRQIRRRQIQKQVDKVFAAVLTVYLVAVVLVTMAMTSLYIFVPKAPLSWVYCAVTLVEGIYDLIWILGPAILSKRYMQMRSKIRKKRIEATRNQIN